MNCRELENRLEGLLEGQLSETERREAERHVAECARCRELQTLARDGVPELSGDDDPALTDAILRQTSGPACGRAHELLPDHSDRALGGADGQLLRLHLEHCRGCVELAGALDWLGEQLPTMASVAPGPGFVAAVMRATTGRHRQWADRAAALRSWWAGLVKRPRFALEASYVGAIVLAVLFGTPFSPLRNLPGRALAMTRVNPVQAIEASMPGIGAEIVAVGQKTWEATGAKVLARTKPMRATLWDKVQRTWKVSRSLGTQSSEMWSAIFQGDFDKSAAHWKGMGTTLKRMWFELTTSPTANQTEGQKA